MFRAIPFHRTRLSQAIFSLSQSSSSYNSLLSSFSNALSLHTIPEVPFDSPSPFTSNHLISSAPVPSSEFSYSQSRYKHESTSESERISAFLKNFSGKSNMMVVQPRLKPESLLRVKLDEALNLANSLQETRDGYYFENAVDLGEETPHMIVQNPDAKFHRPHPATYFGRGTVENVKMDLKSRELESKIDAIFVNVKLSPNQQRNLEQAWGKPVLDRVALIIEIFNAHSVTKEARLQAELAALMYKRSRLIRGPDDRFSFGATGKSEVVSGRGRGSSSGHGFISGSGETEYEVQLRVISDRRSLLLSKIDEVRRHRAIHRASRRKEGVADYKRPINVAIVGYTNAGKSTLLSALSETYVYADDRLFATVDPRVRGVMLPSGRKILASDTVGFITDLPVQLVEAFHATLEEVMEADLLVHVIDSSAPNLDEQRGSVLQVLKQIGVSEVQLQDMIEVWNKIDLQYDNEEMIFEEEDENDEEAEHCCEGEEEDENDEEAEHCLEGEEEEDGEKEEEDGEKEEEEEASIDGDDAENPNVTCEVATINGDDGESESFYEGENPTPTWEEDESMKKDSSDGMVGGPHLKISAMMGTGLQELLQLIDEKVDLKEKREKEEKAALETNPFNKKWRPPPKQ